ncbi:hypothetical protein QA596_05935 [Balneolales bacterium ANBcel1]|nr:hypothetical protein [Balneolales bacterium ANBcel1]
MEKHPVTRSPTTSGRELTNKKKRINNSVRARELSAEAIHAEANDPATPASIAESKCNDPASGTNSNNDPAASARAERNSRPEPDDLK